MEDLFPKLPLDVWVEKSVEYMDLFKEELFDPIAIIIESMIQLFSFLFNLSDPVFFTFVFMLIAWRISKLSVALFTGLGLFLITNLGYWDNTMDTLVLIITTSIISVLIGIPAGILCARKDYLQRVLTPLLDFMQTMPAFVYLIPAIYFFGLGEVPGVIASVIFSMPPIIRLTNLGIRQVPYQLTEAADAYGSSSWQKLRKVQLPIARPTIMAGINQSIMLSLSMVVIAAMIGAKGLGADVYRAVSQVKIGTGFEAGLAIVIIAIILDRLTQNIGNHKERIS